MYNEIKYCVGWHLSDYQLLASQTGSIHSNLTAIDTITITLPLSASQGMMFIFVVQEQQELRIDPGLAAILLNTGATPGKYKSADAVGECLALVADSNGNWIPISHRGSWGEEV